MLNILKHSHSGLRWIILIFLIAAIIKALVGWKNNSQYKSSDKKLNLITMTIVHIQLLVGTVLYIMHLGGKVNFSGMKDSMVRFYTVEHLLMMILATIVITIGFSKSKRNPASASKIVFISYLTGLVLILAGIPWPFRAALGAGWF